MKIGQLAKASQIQIETIRYYEREKLLPPMGRSDNNYRVYSQQHLERLIFIRHCRELDMSLDEIRTLLHFKDAPNENCTQVNELLEQHIIHVETRIKELKSLQQQLKALRQTCQRSQQISQCGILTQLSAAPKPGSAASADKAGPTGHVHRSHSLKERH